MTENKIPNKVNLQTIPLSALRDRTVQKLANSLDGIKIFFSEDGFPRDYRGLAHFADIRTEKIENSRSPTQELLKLWRVQKENSCDLAKLQHIFGLIDRYDVYDDTNFMFQEDAVLYVENKEKERLKESASEQELFEESNILTVDDTLAVKQYYDAFVLFDDSDIDFAGTLIEKVENAGYKLCVKDRDLKGGTFEHEAMITLIAERCNRLIVLVSPDFIKNSNANKFFVNYAQALGIEQRKRKIIPCKIKQCILPPNLSYYFCLDYERSGRLYDFWKKLEDALKDPTKEPLLSMKSIDPNQEKKIEKKQEKFMKLVTSNGIKRNCSDEKLSVVMPPAPKIREASSMFNLTDIGVSEMVEPKKKKKKWYKKILKSPSFLKFENHSEPLSELDEKIPKKKKKWFKKKEAIPAC